ncbi:ferredoxin [Rhodococcus pseudokoreensis]|uniref:Ferredoxin n=1 Tax=Rhodococcus pseudokoreensis TaxID=2811421 RepID=A0A974ZT15_9NOCA|nr:MULTISPECIES: ferredoxin [Rhodococcus]OUS81338.1 ferredoxin [Rhodococcus sp. NCIMB 12038]QSE89411.1 ferredoxin [Rhodococcus pseudokoreensis]
MEIVVDYEGCEGHGECVIAAPEVFDLNDDGDEVIVLDDAPAESLRPKVETAVKLCPVAALRLAD